LIYRKSNGYPLSSSRFFALALLALLKLNIHKGFIYVGRDAPGAPGFLTQHRREFAARRDFQSA
jgi:hypothetical protein